MEQLIKIVEELTKQLKEAQANVGELSRRVRALEAKEQQE